ncbi:MAG: hypothetical protein QNJ74_05760 [Trichodesmium sp. MO_231.B1]|nr:hypothetical protein [Trichodesmium sp. MO_231.B1]
MKLVLGNISKKLIFLPIKIEVLETQSLGKILWLFVKLALRNISKLKLQGKLSGYL